MPQYLSGRIRGCFQQRHGFFRRVLSPLRGLSSWPLLEMEEVLTNAVSPGFKGVSLCPLFRI